MNYEKIEDFLKEMRSNGYAVMVFSPDKIGDNTGAQELERDMKDAGDTCIIYNDRMAESDDEEES